MSAIFVETFVLGGPGPTVAIKDTIDIAGHPTRCGSAVLADAPPALAHAVVVQRLLDGGARIVGKTNTHEFAYGVTGVNAWSGTPDNPRFPGLMPGGSSSGSAAAVAAGLADFALGTDTGGSIRVPAACCGVYGLKPTFGRVSRQGAAPERSSLDCIGPLAGGMAMIELAMALIDPTYRSEAIGDALFGVARVTAEPGVTATVNAALVRAGVRTAAAALPGLDEAFEAALVIMGAETWQAVGVHAGSAALGSDVRDRLTAAGRIGPAEIARAETVRARFRHMVDAALEAVDVLVTPTLPVFPLSLEKAASDPAAALRVTELVRPFNLSGHPAVTLPLTAPGGLPVGLQLIGRRGADARLCAVARDLEARLTRGRGVQS